MNNCLNVVTLCPSIVILCEAENLSSSAQGKLREESYVVDFKQVRDASRSLPRARDERDSSPGSLHRVQNDKQRACRPFDSAQGQ